MVIFYINNALLVHNYFVIAVGASATAAIAMIIPTCYVTLCRPKINVSVIKK